MSRGQQEPAPFAIAADGGTLAAGDGPELLVWRGDGVPAWKQFTDGIIVGLAITADTVVTVDADGLVRRWRRSDGTDLGGVHVGGSALGLEVAQTGVIGVLGAEGVWVVPPNATTASSVVPVPGATAFAFGPGGGSVGVGTDRGRFVAIELASGAAWGSTELPAAVRGVAWSALGTWLVGAERMLYRIKGDGSAVASAITGADTLIASVCCTANGIIAAARTEDRVELYELHANRPIGEYLLRRRVAGLAFGPGLTLAIGLDDGDGNVVDLASGATLRTEPHPGRGRNTWRLENKVDLAAVRGAIAFQQAGGAPIARYVPRAGPDGAGGSSSGCFGGCLAVAAVVAVLAAFCGGMLLLMYVLKASGAWDMVPIR